MSHLRKLPPDVLARIESHLSPSIHRTHLFVSPPSLPLENASSPGSSTSPSHPNIAPNDPRRIRFAASRTSNPFVGLKRLQSDVKPSELLASTRQSLQNDDKRAATNSSIHYILSHVTEISSSIPASTPLRTNAVDQLFEVYLSDIRYRGALWHLLRQIQDPSIFSSSLMIKFARAVIQNPTVYERMFRHTFTLKPTNQPFRVPVLHHLVDTLLYWNVPAEDIAAFFLEERQLAEARDPDRTKEWCLGVWTHIISALGHTDALLMLGEFKKAVQYRYEGRDMAEISTYGRSLIIQPYEVFMRKWTDSQLSDETRKAKGIHKRIPGTLARDLISLIGGQEHLPIYFLNTWMNAERVAQNYEDVMKIWGLFQHDPQPLPTHISPSLREFVDCERQPDARSWKIYWKTKKGLPAAQTTTLLRQDFKRMLELIPLAEVTTDLLDEVLSSITHNSPPDLPLLLCILRIYDWNPSHATGPAPSSRTISVAAAGLLRLWRVGGASFDPLFIPHFARETRHVTSTMNRQKASTFPSEWELATATLRQLIPPEQECLFFAEQFYLPLIKEPPPDQPVTENRHTAIRQDIDSLQAGDEDALNPLTPAHVLLRPVTALVERAIRLALSQRIHDDQVIDRVFDKLVEAVYDEAIPKATIAWVRYDGQWLRIDESEGDVEVEGEAIAEASLSEKGSDAASSL